MRRLIPLLFALLVLISGCSDQWSDIAGVDDITDQMLLERMGNYSASRWSSDLKSDFGSAWQYSAGWGELTGARRLLKLRAREDSTVRAVYTPDETGDGLIVAVLCADDTVVRLSPGDNELSLPEGRNWLVAASYHSPASFQVDLVLETGRLQVDTDVSLSP